MRALVKAKPEEGLVLRDEPAPQIGPDDISDDLASWQNVFAPGGSGLTDIAVGVPG